MQHIKCKNSCKVLSLHSGFFWIFWLKFPMKICWWEIRELFASKEKALLCLKSDCSCGNTSEHIHAAFAGGPWVARAMDMPHSHSQGSGEGPAGQLKHVAWKNSVGQMGDAVTIGKLDHHKHRKRSNNPHDYIWMCPWPVACREGGRKLTGKWFIIRLFPQFTVKNHFQSSWVSALSSNSGGKLSFVDSSDAV